MLMKKSLCILIFLLSIVSSSVAQINHPPQIEGFWKNFPYDDHMMSPRELWESIVVDKAFGEVYYQTLKNDVAWLVLCFAIDQKDAEYAKKMVIEARAVACELPEDYIKSNWETFTKEVGIKGEVKKASGKDAKEHIAWDILSLETSKK